MVLDELLSKRLVILSGKGGVGKSVVGAALALAGVRRRKRVLLVEIDAPVEAARLLGEARAGQQETELRPGLLSVNLNPASVMDEYVRHVVKVERLAQRILESPVYRRFFSAAPGLRELMVLGKIMVLEEARDRWSRRPRYDLIVVDAPATGHGLSFLKVPVAASEAVPVGPVGRNARRVLALLRDAAKTALVIVAVPEEMAVVEAQWFHRLAVNEIGISPVALILNAAHERRFSQAEEARILRLAASRTDGRLARDVGLANALDAARRHIRRRKLTSFYERRLRRLVPLPLLSLPHMSDEPLSVAALEALAHRLDQG